MPGILRAILWSCILLTLLCNNVYNIPAADSIQNIDIQAHDDLEYIEWCSKAEKTSDVDSITRYSDNAIEVAQKLGINPARAFLLKGNGYHLSGQLTLAVECYMQAAKYDQQFNDIIGLGASYTSLADAYISQQNHNNARTYLLKAVELFDRENDSLRLASALHNLGFEYYRIQQYDSALVLFTNSCNIYQKLNYEQGNAYCIGNAGLVYSKLNELEKAEENLLKAIFILQQYADTRAIADFTIEYAFVLQRKGKIGNAIQNAHKGFALASKNNYTELKRDAAFRLSKIFEQTHQYDSAFHYLLLYYTFSDSIRNLESIQKTADLRTEFEVAQKQAEVDILEKNKTMQLIIIISLGAIVLLAAVFILLVYINLKRNRKLNIILEERRKLLEKQSNELRDLNRVKDRFFSIISHDLRTPIASLGGISFLIKESLTTDDKSVLKQAADYIDQTVVSLTELLENLLNWALSQQGKFPFKEELIDLEMIINEVTRTFTSVIMSKNQHLNLCLEPGLMIKADRNSIMSIIRNLVSNAIKFTNARGNIIISSRNTGNGSVEIKVADNGIGISEDKINDLFKLKEDKSSLGTKNEKGLGLGLNLVHEFVMLNHGTIRVESRLHEGTTFILDFPLKK